MTETPPLLSVIDLLDRAKDYLGAQSDYRLAKLTKIRPNALSNYRLGKSLPDEKACRALALAAHIDVDETIAQIGMMRAKDDETRQIYRGLWDRIRASRGFLQAGYADVENLLLIAIISVAAYALLYWPTATFDTFAADSTMYIM